MRIYVGVSRTGYPVQIFGTGPGGSKNFGTGPRTGWTGSKIFGTGYPVSCKIHLFKNLK